MLRGYDDAKHAEQLVPIGSRRGAHGFTLLLPLRLHAS